MNMNKSVLNLFSIPTEDLWSIIYCGLEIKKNPHLFYEHLKGKKLALLFQKTSTRTRVSFEVGMYELGGYTIYLDWKDTNFTLGALQDEIKVLSRYVDVIVARVYHHDDLKIMATHSDVPIINGLCNLYHPCQALTDLMTIMEKKGTLEGIKISYVGDGNNVCNSLIVGCCKLGVSLNVATPKDYEPSEVVRRYAQQSNAPVNFFTDPVDAVTGADVVYTDTWVSMGQESETKIRHTVFRPYQLNDTLYGCTNNALIMHDLPAHRGYEITDDMMNHRNSIIFTQSENRKHAQKALLLWVFHMLH